MSIGFRQLLVAIRERPGMYFGGEPTFREATAFVLGWDTATEALLGFQEWLLVRTDGQANLWWPAVLRQHVLPGLPQSETPSPEQNKMLVASLWDYLIEFLDERSGLHGSARIFEAYLRWRDERPYHSDDPIGSLNEREGVIDGMPPPHVSAEVREVHRLRRRPLSSFTAADCHRFVSFWLSLEVVVPRSIALLNTAENCDDGNDEGQLLLSLLDLGRDWWAEHPNYLREFRRATAQLFTVGDRQQRAIEKFERLMAASSSTSG